jgi:hypothetical protein
MAVQNDVSMWQERIDRTAKIREQKLKEAKLYVDLYKSNQWASVKTSLKTKPVTNLIFSHIKSQLPVLYFQNPKWFVSPAGKQRKDFAANAEIAQYYLNYYVRENCRIALKRQMRFAILDAFFFFGVIKTGYIPQMEIIGNFKKSKRTLEDGSQEEIYLNDNNEVVTPEETVANEKFVSRRRAPGSMIFDMEAESCFEDGRYIIEEINMPLQDVKNDKKYKNTTGLAPSYQLKSDKPKLSDSSEELPTDDIDRVTLYEIYDIEHDELITMGKGNDKLLRKDSMPSGIDGHPYSFLVFNDIPDEIYPLSDVRVLKSPQECYNKATGMIFEHAGKGARKYGYTPNAFAGDGDEELEKAKSSEDGTWFQVRELPLAKGIEQLPMATNDPSIDKMAAMSLGNFREAGGSTEQDRGVVERRKTAFEASKMTQANDIKKQDRKSLVEDFAADVGSKLLQSMQANMTIEDAVEISGPTGAKEWKTVSRQNIKGQMTVTVEVGSSTPKLPEYEREDFITFMQAMQIIPPEMFEIYIKMEGLMKAIPRMFPAIEDLDLLNTEEEIKFNKAQALERKKIEMMIANKGATKPMGGGGNAAV